MDVSENERIYATWMHIAGLSMYIGVPFGHVLVPLILWALKHKESYYIDQQGRDVLNFQLTISFYMIFCFMLFSILIGYMFIVPVVLLHIIASVMGAMRTYRGKTFRYPVTFRIIRPAE